MRKILDLPKNSKGMSLASVLISAGIIGVSAFILMNAQKTLFGTQGEVRREIGALQWRGKILGALGTEAAMAKTIAASPPMACLQNLTDCSTYASAPATISVMFPDGTQLTSATDPNFGFTGDGRSCTTFNSVNGNDSCPFRYEVQWVPLCANPSCLNPQSQVIGTLKYKGQTNNLIAAGSDQFNFKLILNISSNTLSSQCTSLNGYYNPSNGQCTLKMYGSKCPSGQVVLYINQADNTISCGYLMNARCPAGTAMGGITAAGVPICKNITFCPKKTDFGTWRPFPADRYPDGGDGGGDGCDGKDGNDGNCSDGGASDGSS